MRHEHGFHGGMALADARKRLLDLVDPVSRTETMDPVDAHGRVLAADVVADRDVPHYDRAAMDGWAVKAADTTGASKHAPRSLEIADTPGHGRATRVHTGSPLPAEADAVVMIEDVDRRDDHIEVKTPVAVGRHVGERGEDVEAGAVVLAAGDSVTPSALALLKSLAVDSVEVFARPSVAVIPTGEELVEADPRPGEVIETNGAMVSAYVASWGGEPRYRSIVPDDPEALESAIRRDLDADMVVTTGGSSVGERDHLPEVIDAIGDLTVHGVAIQPGHPFGFGQVEGAPILMLPGYPVSCAVNAVEFLRPAMRRAGRFRELPDPTLSCELTEKIASSPGKRTYARVHLERHDGAWLATPAMTSGAGILSSMAGTDALVIVPEAVEGFNRGDRVTAVIWE